MLRYVSRWVIMFMLRRASVCSIMLAGIMYFDSMLVHNAWGSFKALSYTLCSQYAVSYFVYDAHLIRNVVRVSVASSSLCCFVYQVHHVVLRVLCCFVYQVFMLFRLDMCVFPSICVNLIPCGFMLVVGGDGNWVLLHLHPFMLFYVDLCRQFHSSLCCTLHDSLMLTYALYSAWCCIVLHHTDSSATWRSDSCI